MDRGSSGAMKHKEWRKKKSLCRVLPLDPVVKSLFIDQELPTPGSAVEFYSIGELLHFMYELLLAGESGQRRRRLT